MLKKLFGQKKMPTKSGVLTAKLDGSRWIKVFDLILVNMENAPQYRLTHQISIGSEIGNIVIAESSISPRHATFVLQQDVVSVIDHGSTAGTVVNGQKIPAGKYIILEESDHILIGDLEIKIKSISEVINEKDIPAIPSEGDVVSHTIEDEKFEEEVLSEEKPKETPKVVAAKKIVPHKTQKKKLDLVKRDTTATNALLRVVAVVCDLLLSFAIITVFIPFDEFKDFLNFIPSMLADLSGLNGPDLWNVIREDLGPSADIIQDLWSFLASTFHPGPLFLVFITLRVFTTFIFGVSLFEYLLGIKAAGNPIWNRIGGILRVLVGVVTGPLLVLDTPAIISKRTFKEFITFTHTYIENRILAFIGGILYPVLLIALVLISPLFQGLEVVEPILINSKIDQRVKVSVEQTPTAVSEPQNLTSEYLKVNLNYQPNEVSIIPHFKFVGAKAKLHFKGEVSFFHKELTRPVTVELLKSFDLKELLAIGMKGNIFLFDKFPELHNYVYSPQVAHAAFKKLPDPKQHEKFAKEFIDFTTLAFSLGQDSAFEVMQTSTPLIKSLIDYRMSLLALLEYKDFTDMSFIKIGQSVFMKVHYDKQKPFDLLVPLFPEDGRIYKVQFDQKEKVGNLASKFYKFVLAESLWLPQNKKPLGEIMDPFQVIDTFTINFSRESFTADKAQALYGYYYEKSAEVLRGQNATELALWMNSIDSVLRIVELMKGNTPTEVENPMEKIIQNFRDLKNALENKNLQFFGVTDSTSV